MQQFHFLPNCFCALNKWVVFRHAVAECISTLKMTFSLIFSSFHQVAKKNNYAEHTQTLKWNCVCLSDAFLSVCTCASECSSTSQSQPKWLLKYECMVQLPRYPARSAPAVTVCSQWAVTREFRGNGASLRKPFLLLLIVCQPGLIGSRALTDSWSPRRDTVGFRK